MCGFSCLLILWRFYVLPVVLLLGLSRPSCWSCLHDDCCSISKLYILVLGKESGKGWGPPCCFCSPLLRKKVPITINRLNRASHWPKLYHMVLLATREPKASMLSWAGHKLPWSMSGEKKHIYIYGVVSSKQSPSKYCA